MANKGHLSNDNGKTFLCGTTIESVVDKRESYMDAYDPHYGLGSVWYRANPMYGSECLCVECSNHLINVLAELKYSVL